LYGLFGFEGPVDYQGNTFWTVAFSLGALGLLTAVTTIYLAFRPEHPAARLTEEDEAHLRALLEKHGGRDSLGHFALRRDEAVVDVADFSLAGRAMRNVRQMVKRIERAGYETRVRRVRDLGEAELERIRNAAEDWRGTDTERGFSMALGRIGDTADGDCLI